MHEVVILALDGVVPFDLGIPCEVFGTARTGEGEPAYRVHVSGERSRVRTGTFDICVSHKLDIVARADTLIIPGIKDPSQSVSGRVLDAIGAAWANGARIASICTGAFVFAATGLLDGHRATTHWLTAADFERRFPKVTLDPDVLFVDEGRIVTSAGALAGMDMCLHLVGRDHGQAAAAHAARLAVAPLHRDGGQAQFIRHELPRSDDSLAPLLDWMFANLDQPLGVEKLAARAATSLRTFARRFREQTGTTPLQWLLTARVRRAQELLETTHRPVDEIAMDTGFESPVTFRARFQQIVGVSPVTYRRRFNQHRMSGMAGSTLTLPPVIPEDLHLDVGDGWIHPDVTAGDPGRSSSCGRCRSPALLIAAASARPCFGKSAASARNPLQGATASWLINRATE